MAKMHFKYASMNSGKSIDLMRTAHNYEENGYKVLVAKPSIDTKAGEKISSRIGLERDTDIVLLPDSSVYHEVTGKLNDVKCILIDEAQFLTQQQVDEFYNISKVCDIPVICYGLRNNFKMEAFPGSKALLEKCDELEEILTLCECGNIARYNARMLNGEYEIDGNEVVIDGEEGYLYKPLCGECYLKKVKRLDFKVLTKKLKYKS